MNLLNSNNRKKLLWAVVATTSRRTMMSTAWTTSAKSTVYYVTTASMSSKSNHAHSNSLHNIRPSTSHFSTTMDDIDTSTKELNRNDYPDNIILFDGVCNFCNTWVDLLLRLDSQNFVFAPLQSSIGKNLLVSIGKESDDISSVLLIKKDGSFYDKSDCVLQVVKELGPLGNVFSKMSTLVVPIVFRNGIYDMVAENRYNFLGKRDECRSGDPKYFDRFIS